MELSPNGNRMPIVCIWGSAGAVKEYVEIIRRVRPDTGMAFVIVPHLSPKYKSYLVEILSRATTMPVREAHNGMHLHRNEVAVIPPGMEMVIRSHRLWVAARSKIYGWSNVSDLFLTSLAQSRNGKQVAVILSGMGRNGSKALKRFKRAGGTIFVQKPGSADFSDMPLAAIATGCADAVLTPSAIADALVAFGGLPNISSTPART